MLVCFFFFQAEDGIRDLVRSRGLGDVYKRQGEGRRREFAEGHEVLFLVDLGTLPRKTGGAVVVLSLIHI